MCCVLCDPPHLMKNVRNNLRKHGFNVDGNLVQWKHIEDFYHADSKLPIRMAPKLMHKHIELPPFAQLNVNLATKFSATLLHRELPPRSVSELCPKMLNTLHCLCRADAQSVQRFQQSDICSDAPWPE